MNKFFIKLLSTSILLLTSLSGQIIHVNNNNSNKEAFDSGWEYVRGPLKDIVTSIDQKYVFFNKSKNICDIKNPSLLGIEMYSEYLPHLFGEDNSSDLNNKLCHMISNTQWEWINNPLGDNKNYWGSKAGLKMQLLTKLNINYREQTAAVGLYDIVLGLIALEAYKHPMSERSLYDTQWGIIDGLTIKGFRYGPHCNNTNVINIFPGLINDYTHKGASLNGLAGQIFVRYFGVDFSTMKITHVVNKNIIKDNHTVGCESYVTFQPPNQDYRFISTIDFTKDILFYSSLFAGEEYVNNN